MLMLGISEDSQGSLDLYTIPILDEQDNTS
jgi:hypothetical protein